MKESCPVCEAEGVGCPHLTDAPKPAERWTLHEANDGITYGECANPASCKWVEAQTAGAGKDVHPHHVTVVPLAELEAERKAHDRIAEQAIAEIARLDKSLAAAEKERDEADEAFRDLSAECQGERHHERVSGMAVLLERLYEALLNGVLDGEGNDADYWRKEIRRELSTTVDDHVAADEGRKREQREQQHGDTSSPKG